MSIEVEQAPQANVRQEFIRSEGIGKLAEALAQAQAKIDYAAKDAQNPHFRSRYADLPAVIDATKPALTEHGISVVQLPVVASRPNHLGLVTILLHSSGEFIGSKAEIPMVKNDPQALGSAMTYLRRYTLAAITNLKAEDDDGEGAMGRGRDAAGRIRDYGEGGDGRASRPSGEEIAEAAEATRAAAAKAGISGDDYAALVGEYTAKRGTLLREEPLRFWSNLKAAIESKNAAIPNLIAAGKARLAGAAE